jgi:hypothetical protein
MWIWQLVSGLLFLAGIALLAVTTAGTLLSWVLKSLAGRALPSRLEVYRGVRLIAGLAAGVACCGVLLFKADPFNQISFNRQVWLTSPDGMDCPRGKMAGDLLRFHLNKGMSKQEVVEVVGTPDGKDRTDTGQEVYRYYLGCWSGLRIDEDYLDVVFDASGRVSAAYVWQS